MKNILLLSATTFFFLMSCSDKTIPVSENIHVSSDFSAKTSDFAFDFWKAYEAEYGGSYVISPLSLNMALGMLVNGAEGETKEEIINLLGFEGADLNQINRDYAEMIRKLPYIDPKVKNHLANSVWHKNSFDIENGFTDRLKSEFSADIFSEDFSSSKTLKKINNWASDQTNGKVKEILDRIDENAVLFLVNALYFKGDWSIPFKKSDTYKDSFNGEKKKTEVDFMRLTDNFSYYEAENYKLLELPYGNEKYSFIALLPKSISTNQLIQSFNEKEWTGALNKMHLNKVDVTLPKFEIETDNDLINIMQDMGMVKAFIPLQADFTGISKINDLHVGLIKQSAYLSIDEKGTEAAAVTTIGMQTNSAGGNPLFKADRPFVFAIVEKTSNTIQFIGKISDL